MSEAGKPRGLRVQTATSPHRNTATSNGAMKGYGAVDEPQQRRLRPIGSDEVTVSRSGSKKSLMSGSVRTKKKKKQQQRAVSDGSVSTSQTSPLSLEEKLSQYKERVQQEKAGKRKLFHSLVKLANELRRTRDDTVPLLEQRNYADKLWYEGGIWRAPAVLPGVVFYNRNNGNQTPTSNGRPIMTRSLRAGESVSLTDLFFGLAVVTAFTRVGVAISTHGFVDVNSLLYFAVFWTVWSKEASYSTRFDTTDLSAQAVTLVTCFAVLFASLSVQAPLNSVDGGRVMIMAAFVAGLHLLLHVRVVLTVRRRCRRNGDGAGNKGGLLLDTGGADEDNKSDLLEKQGSSNNSETASLQNAVMNYGIFNIFMNFCELIVWLLGVVVFSPEWNYRWLLFLGGILLALRVPRAFLANDFHAACSKRGVLFILLLGFLLQSIIVVASEFFAYQTPTLEHYAFIGAACLMLFCMKMLYVDDADTLAEDHAYMVNRVAAFFFNVGNFLLLLSTTVLGSGLNLLTHDYLAATQALSGPSKGMVCGGFSAVLFATFFIKSMHLKRVPADGRGQCLFITAYLVQTVTLLGVVGVSSAMAMGKVKGLLAALMESDIVLLFVLSGAALVVLIMHWLDEGVELALYGTSEVSRSYRVHPFGFWWCLKPPSLSDESSLYDPTSPMGMGFGESSESTDLRFSENGFRTAGVSESTLNIMSPLLGDASTSSGRDYKATSATSLSTNNEFV